ncbi:hypothetical protein N2152v2_003892 [Parachlorella kessleri]
MRAGAALAALSSNAALQTAVLGSLRQAHLANKAPALAAAIPSTTRQLWRLGFSSSSSQLQDSKAEAAAQAAVEAATGGGAAGGDQAQQGEQQQQQAQQEEQQQLSAEELQKANEELQAQLEEERKKGEDMKERLLRTLADMENLRERTARATAEAKQYATQSLVKSIIDVADNLERAAGAVPLDELNGEKEVDKDRALALLRSLRDGVLMTDSILMKIMEKEGVVRYDPMGQQFDPNLHNALFEVPDATKEPGTVAVVIKRGYLLHERPVRAAEVGVVAGRHKEAGAAAADDHAAGI